MARILEGKAVAASLSGQLRTRVEALAGRGVVPCLAILRVGDNPSDLAYERAANVQQDGRLTPAEQFACDEYRDACYPALFTVYLFAAAGRWQEAKDTLASAKQKKRVLRLLSRCAGLNAK